MSFKGFEKDWWRGAVIYQVYPRSYLDTNGDGIGDLQGITKKIPYIASLGVEAIWVSPFFKSPMKDYGYDVSDYCDVDPMFGTLADADEMVQEAHKHGLKVLVDLVANHTSEEHPWFVESRSSRTNPKADWYVWADPKPDGSPPNNWLSIFGGSSWEWDTKRRQYYLHNFLVNQPDLNFHHPEVRQAMLDAAKFWLDRGVNGFRLDAINFCFHHLSLQDNPPNPARTLPEVPDSNPYAYQLHLYDKTQPDLYSFLEELRRLTDKYPDSVMVGEMGDVNAIELMPEYTAHNKRIHKMYTFYLLTEKFNASFIRGILEAVEAKIGDGWPSWSFGNHDVKRVASRWNPTGQHHDAFVKMALALMTSFRSTSIMYQGEELGLKEADLSFDQIRDPYGIKFWPEFKGRDGCRTPMPWESGKAHGGFTSGEPWLPVPADHLAASVDVMEKDANSSLNFYRRFLSWRKAYLPLKCGSMKFHDAPENVLFIERAWEGEHILIAFNLSTEAVEATLPALGSFVPLDDCPFAYGVEGNRLSLPPYGVCFLGVK